MPCGVHVHCYYMTRRAVLPKSNTGTGTLGRIQTTYRFCTLAVFNLEFLEIREFISSNRIFPMFFSHVAFDWWCHIVKQMRNARDYYEPASVSWSHVTEIFRKNRIFAGAEKSKILVVVDESEGVAIFFRPCRGPLAGACVPEHMTRRAASCRVIPNGGPASLCHVWK